MRHRLEADQPVINHNNTDVTGGECIYTLCGAVELSEHARQRYAVLVDESWLVAMFVTSPKTVRNSTVSNFHRMYNSKHT